MEQLSLYWILFIAFFGLAFVAGLGYFGLVNYGGGKLLGYSTATLTVVGTVGGLITVGLMLGGVLEPFQNTEEETLQY